MPNGCCPPNVVQPISLPYSRPGKITLLRARTLTTGWYIIRVVSTCGQSDRSRLVRAFASSTLRIEFALTRILDDAILDAIVRIAGVKHRLVDRRELVWRNDAGFVSDAILRDPSPRPRPPPVVVERGAPATMPSKSSGKRCAAFSACRPPAEQPLKYAQSRATAVEGGENHRLAVTAISCTAR